MSSETDRGVMAILDSRINSKRYGPQIIASLIAGVLYDQVDASAVRRLLRDVRRHRKTAR